MMITSFFYLLKCIRFDVYPHDQWETEQRLNNGVVLFLIRNGQRPVELQGV